MFVGHYGPSFLAKRADRTIPLWVLFVAVQFLECPLGAVRSARHREGAHRPGVHEGEPARSLLHAVHARPADRDRMVNRVRRRVPAARATLICTRVRHRRTRRVLALGARPARASSRSPALRQQRESGTGIVERARDRAPARSADSSRRECGCASGRICRERRARSCSACSWWRCRSTSSLRRHRHLTRRSPLLRSPRTPCWRS